MMPLTQPVPLLQPDICRANIRRMVGKARKNGVRLRPHFKTHQSAEIGEWFSAEGVSEIAVSSLTMAEYFACAGWSDITVAFPVNILEIETINRLASQIRLGLLVVQPETIDFLDRQLAAPADIWVKIDVGTRRTGILPTDKATLETVFTKIERAPRLRFRGFLAHAGHTYAVRSKSEIQKIHEETTTILKDLKARYRARFPDLEISTGDTPSCSVAEGWEDVDEMRPGNFVFYDLMQVQIGACRPEDIAVALAAPVVAKHADRQEIVVYGGGIHLSKDRLTTAGGQACFGWPVRLNANGWERPNGESFVKSLSQEHGVVKCAPAFFERIRVGDLIGILPVHSCMMVDLFARYVDVLGGRIEKFVFGK